jgi:DNA repair exonuclease SbcCD ATPase subunit
MRGSQAGLAKREAKMRRCVFFVVGFLLATSVALGQSSQTDSQTLRDLLTEIRGLRQDLRASTVATERLQILVYRLQVQEQVVARVSRQVDDAKARLSDLESRRSSDAAALQRVQDMHDNAAPGDAKSIEETIAQLKARLDRWQNQEAQAQTAESQAEDQLRIEQSRVSALEERLNQQDRELESFSRSLAGAQPNQQQ